MTVIGKNRSLSPPGLFRVQNQQRTMKVYLFALNDRIEYALITKNMVFKAYSNTNLNQPPLNQGQEDPEVYFGPLQKFNSLV